MREALGKKLRAQSVVCALRCRSRCLSLMQPLTHDYPMTSSRHAFRFGDYTFDAETGELVGPGGTTRLEPQPAKVLAALLARPGELVTRED